MARTTLDLDPEVLRDLEQLQAREDKPLGQLVSDLVRQALGRPGSAYPRVSKFHWNSRDLGARVDLSDKAAVYSKLDEAP
jgi:hypothetical protein